MADAGHIETDRILAELEKKLKKTYQQASKNAEGKFRRYMRDFVRKDEQHKKDVKAGLWSEKEYQDWRKNQLLYANTLNEIRDVIAKDLQHTDKMAIQIVRDTQPDVYAENYNYATYTIEQGAQVDTSFTMYDRSTVERLMKDDPQLLPKPSKRRQREIDASDRRWNRQKLQSAFTASILAGDSIPTMAKRISGVAAMDWHSAVRNARTMTTGAENGGRADSYKRAKELGIDVEQEWVATLDGRTRDSHREIDGEKIKVGEKFSNGLRFPGDPEGRAGEVYNCRCTTIAVVDGIDPMAFNKSDVLQRKLDNADITYEEWKHQHRKPEDSIIKNVIAQGLDILSTWKRRPDKFGFEIEDVINAQGFDGKPRVVSRAEFDKAVKAANGGKGFIAQRTYSAPDKETLNAYQDELYNGKWYVDCSTGGAQYGQGMYAASDYTGKLTAGIKEEMEHYAKLGMSRQGDPQKAYANTVYMREMESVKLPFPDKYRDAFTDKAGITDTWTKKDSDEMQFINKWTDDHPDEAASLKAKLEKAQEAGAENGMKIESMSKDEFEKTYPNAVPGYKTETFTLDPSAKVISFNDIQKLQFDEGKLLKEKLEERYTDPIDRMIAMHEARLETDEEKKEFFAWKRSSPENKKRVDDFEDNETDIWDIVDRQKELAYKYRHMDTGAFATLLGYDAINAEGHGASGSYTVILNRTKCIFLKE